MADIALFRRKIIVTVDTLQITDLDMSFAIKKTLKPHPNTCELKIFNLNEEHRSAIEQKKVAKVQIEAGYEGGTSVLFIGDLRSSISPWIGPDCVTSLAAGDGEKAIRKARVNVSIKKGTKTPDVLKAVAESLGVGKGNLASAVAKLKSSGIADLFSQGTVLTGSASRELTAVCRSSGLIWCVNDGKLQILGLRESLEGTAINLNQNTGLIGSPTIDNDGILSAKMLLIPDVIPGRKMVIQSDRLKGQYRLEECVYSGDTAGENWYIDIKAKRY